MFDLLIKNGRIVDGSGTPWFYGDVAVKDGRICAVGMVGNAQAKQVIDAKGKVVAPGFLDIHTHGDVVHFNGVNDIKVRQGVTTEIVGNCGLSAAPVSPENAAGWKAYVDPYLGDTAQPYNWTTFGAYLSAMDGVSLPHDVAAMAGTGTIRCASTGFTSDPLTGERMEKVLRTAQEAVDSGAIGFSVGLVYLPDGYSSDRELSQIASVLRGTGRPLVMHIRGEGMRLLESVEQAISIAEEAGVPLHISHLKGIDKRGSAQIDGALAAIANARARGLDVTADAYPYLAGATQLLSFLGPEVMHDGVEGALALLRDPVSRRAIKEHMHDDFPTWENYLHTVGWDQIQIATVDDPNCKQFCGKTIAQAAEMMGLAPDDAALELLNQNNGTMVIFAHYMYLEDVLKIYRQPYTFVASDSMYLVNGLPHPRLYGTFARILELVRTQPGMVSLEEAVRKMTSFPARRFNLADRGLLRPGLKADITVFDAETVCDNTSYLEPRCYPGGIEHVFVSGVPVIENGAFTGRTPGKMLRG